MTVDKTPEQVQYENHPPCLFCGKDMTPNKIGVNYVESPSKFAERKHCNFSCYRENIRKKNEEEFEVYSENGKVCCKCGEHKPASEFPKAHSKRYASYCQACWKLVRREYLLKKWYGLTPEDYRKMFSFQSGKCAICSRPPKTSLHTDHDHKTGLVRGLLCWHCNVLLGKSRDNIERLLAAVKYLQNPPSISALGRRHIGPTGRITNKSRRKRK